VAGEKTLVGLHQHVENRIADPENVVFCVSHPSVLFTAVCAKKPSAAKKAAAYQIGPAPARLPVPHPRATASPLSLEERRSRRVSKDVGPSVAASFETPLRGSSG
jgi:hypothetical protein